MRGLYAYTKTEGTPELNFGEGDLMKVLRRFPGGWMEVLFFFSFFFFLFSFSLTNRNVTHSLFSFFFCQSFSSSLLLFFSSSLLLFFLSSGELQW